MNIQDFSSGLGKIDYDLSVVANWEHLLPGEPLKFRRMEVPDYMDDDEIQALTINDEKHLDMPFYWSQKISLSHQRKTNPTKNHSISPLNLHFFFAVLANRFPSGKRQAWYKRTHIEEFAHYVQEDGLMSRISRFNDFDCTFDELYQIEEHYEHRQDCLVKIIYNLPEKEVTEFFKRGREDAVKSK